jgi:heptose-I-phosphate ethanolaminephosphotransferase
MPPVPLTQVHISEPDFRPKVTRQDRFSTTRFLAWFLFFFYFSGVHQTIIYFSGIAGFFGISQSLVMSLLWLVPVMLFPARGKLIAGIAGVVLWATSLFSMGYLALYRQDFSQSVIFIIFESNWAESSEFLHSYFAWWMVPALAVYTLIPWLIWRRLQPIGGTPVIRLPLTIALCLAVCWPMLDRVIIKKDSLANGFYKQVDSMEPVAPWQLVMGYVKYRQALSHAESRLLASDKPPLEDLVDNNADTPNTLVLVIGESTNARRMGIYGYYRDTTPRLAAMSDELLVFDQVYASRPYTVESLVQALSFADQLQPNLHLEKPTLIDVMKQAGYRTYWITNQQTQTHRNTLITTFSKQADEQIYLNNNRSQNSAQYDEVVFGPFEDLLNRSESKKFILVHLIGTHRAYHYRYPDTFKIFDDDEDLPPWVRKKRHRREYNEFDNSIVYNDFVVASLIEHYLVYFADHGEEVYDYPHHLFAGRDEAAPTPAMYSVPFLAWRSESWKRNNRIDVSYDTTRRMYSLSDFFHTWMDMAGIRFSEFDPGKSIISRWYQPGPVLIGDPAKPEALVDVRQKFFPATANTLPVPALLQPIKPAYGQEDRAVTGTVPVHDRSMRHP